MRYALISSIGLFVLGAFLLVPLTAQAQTPQQQSPQQPPEVDVSEQEIERVADAYVAIADVRRQYQPQMQQAESQEQAQEIQQSMSDEVDALLEDMEGMSVERYDKIIRAARADESLRTKILEKVQEKQNRNGG